MASRIDSSQNRNLYVGIGTEVAVNDGNAIVTGNVGIGTTSPGRPLTINSDNADKAIRILENDSANESWDIGVDVDGDLNFFNSADTSPSVTFLDNGNVGIGMTSPSTKLEVVDTFSVQRTSTDNEGFYVTVSGADANAIVETFYQEDSGALYGFRKRYDGSTNLYQEFIHDNSATGTEVYRVNRSTKNTSILNGNVGIGTTSPTAKLQVAGTTTYNSDSAQTLRVCDAADVSKGIHIGFDTTVNAGIIQAGDFGVSYRNLSLNPNAGNVGIGTTTPTATTGIKLDVIGGIGAWAANNTSTLKLFNGRLVGAGRQIANLVSYNGNGALDLYDSANALKIHLQGSGNSYLNGGNVGIGTTAPGSKLHVDGGGFTQISTPNSIATSIRMGNNLQTGLQFANRFFNSIGGTISTGVWIPIVTVADTGTFRCTLTTAAHSNVTFIAARGYGPSNRAHLQVIDWTYNANGGYANVSGLRIRQNGQVEMQMSFTSGPNVSVSVVINGIGAAIVSSLVETTSTESIIDTIFYESDGMIRSKGGLQINNIQALSSAATVFLTADSATGTGVGANFTNLIKSRTAAQVLSDIGAAPAVTGGYLPLSAGSSFPLTGALYYNGSIRSTTPASKLILSNSSTTTELHAAGSGGIAFKDSGNNTKMVIDSNGNVGIGATSPDGQLDVTDGNSKMVFDGASSDRPLMYFQHNAVPVNGEEVGLFDFRGYNSASQDTRYVIWTAKAEDVTDGTEDGSLQLKTMKAGTATTTFTGRSGKVGIANDNPAQALDVTGKIRVTDDIILAQQNGRIDYDNGVSTGALRFFSTSGNTERMRITSAGDVGIGATPTTGYKLDAVKTTPGYSIVGRHASGGKVGIYNSTGDNGIGTINNYNFNLFTNNSAPQITLNTAGDVGIGTTSPDHLLDLYKSTSTTSSTTGTTLQRLWNYVGNDLKQQKTFIDFVFQDDNSNEYPQVRIGAEVGQNGDANTQEKEGSGAFVVYTNNATGVGPGSPTGLAERFRVDYAGNVGIGTTSPSTKLHVIGQDATFYSNTGAQSLQVGRNANERLELYVNDNMGKITAIQDSDNNGPHNFILNRIFAGTGSNDFLIQKDGSTQLVINTNGNVGIGTTSPTYGLDVMSSAVNNSARFRNSAGGDTLVRIIAGNYNTEIDARLFIGEADAYGMTFEYDGSANIGYIGMNDNVDPTGAFSKRIQMSRGGTEIAFMAGNVGIGTTTPETPLHVLTNTTDNASTMLIQNGSTGDASIKFNISGDTYSIGIDNSDSDKFKLSYGAVGTNDRIVVNTSGNVGINNSIPNEKLSVRGNVELVGEGVGDCGIRYIKYNCPDDSTYNVLGLETSGLTIYNRALMPSNGAIIFQNQSNNNQYYIRNSGGTNATFQVGQGAPGSNVRFFINGSGNVGIGNTASTASVKLEVTGNTLLKNSNGVGDLYLGNYATANHFRFHTNNSNTYFDMNCGDIYWRQGTGTRYTFFPTTANMTINGTLTQNSDVRRKENIVEIKDCISKVKAMRGVYYNRTDINTEVTKVGVIAQEVEAVLPEVILESPEDGLKSVAYSELTSVLINAIKEQQEIIEDLKTRITQLENNN